MGGSAAFAFLPVLHFPNRSRLPVSHKAQPTIFPNLPPPSLQPECDSTHSKNPVRSGADRRVGGSTAFAFLPVLHFPNRSRLPVSQKAQPTISPNLPAPSLQPECDSTHSKNPVRSGADRRVGGSAAFAFLPVLHFPNRSRLPVSQKAQPTIFPNLPAPSLQPECDSTFSKNPVRSGADRRVGGSAAFAFLPVLHFPNRSRLPVSHKAQPTIFPNLPASPLQPECDSTHSKNPVRSGADRRVGGSAAFAFLPVLHFPNRSRLG